MFAICDDSGLARAPSRKTDCARALEVSRGGGIALHQWGRLRGCCRGHLLPWLDRRTPLELPARPCFVVLCVATRRDGGGQSCAGVSRRQLCTGHVASWLATGPATPHQPGRVLLIRQARHDRPHERESISLSLSNPRGASSVMKLPSNTQQTA